MGKRKAMPPDVAEAVLARADGACEAMIPGVCVGQVQHLHHRKMRSQGGGHTQENLIALCHRCHSHVHHNPAWSYERGLLIHSWGEATWPLKYYRGVHRKEEEDGSNQND